MVILMVSVCERLSSLKDESIILCTLFGRVGQMRETKRIPQFLADQKTMKESMKETTAKLKRSGVSSSGFLLRNIRMVIDFGELSR